MFLGIDYPTWWFLVFGAIISGYAILDGFDLGAGALPLLLKKEQSRRIKLNAIGPVWDGNEVWLVIGGGALFAGFPVAYAAIFSAFYMPLNEHKEFAGNWLSFFNTFSAMIAITTLALFMMHGAIYLAMKTENRLYTELKILAKNFTIFFVVAFGLSTLYTLLYIPHLSDRIRGNPLFFILPVLMILAIANIPRQLNQANFKVAFLSSSVTIAALLMMVAIEVFPHLVMASNNPLNSITIYNGSSSPKTLKILLIFALIGTPLVGIYTSFVFWTFKGKVKLDEMSY